MNATTDRPPLVLFRVDASNHMGGGHVMRCLALAEALVSGGAYAGFICASLPEDLRTLIARAGHALWLIDPEPQLLSAKGDWDGEVLPEARQAVDAARTADIVGALRPDWLVLDHYRLDGRWGARIRAFAGRLMVLDDLANRPHDCDLLVDQTLGRAGDEYAHLLPAGCRTLLGARYALLRAEFAAARTMALQRRRHAHDVGRLLVSLGATDIGGTTIRVLQALLDAGVACTIDVVLSRSSPSHDAVHRLAARMENVVLHVDTRAMSSLIAAADLAVGAAGTSSWERCCLGLPAVTVTLAENQLLVAQRLAEAGATVATDSPEGAAAAVVALLDDGPRRAAMSAAAFAVTAGDGARTVVGEMLTQPEHPDVPKRVSTSALLRAAVSTDAEVIWLWRNDPTMRAMAKRSAPILWTDHERWFRKALRSGTCEHYVLDVDGRPAAAVRFDATGEGAAVSINVAPEMRGRGVGQLALALACKRYDDEVAPAELVADVRAGNEPSLRLFRSAGFRELERSRDGFVRWRRAAAAPTTARSGG